MPQITSNRRVRDGLARRDRFGRDLSYLHSCLPSLQKLNSVDLYSHDFESGYSPLHVTLQRGYLRKSFQLYKRWKEEMEFICHKFGGHIFNQLDREGLNPLELYSMHFYRRGRNFPLYIRYQKDLRPEIKWSADPLTVSQDVRWAFMELPSSEEEQECIKRRGGSHLLTLGSNVNYQLGTGTKDDRQNMYQLVVGQLEKISKLDLTNSRFSKVLISRYHSIVVTTENKVYTCGNSSRGRLGNGAADTPQANFTEVMDLGESEICMIDTSNHHSLLMTASSDVYSWGWNGYGQLGYSTANKNVDPEKNFGSVPRRIPFLEGEDVTNIACSKIHSCVATRDGKLIMWGLNVGQLGGSKPVHKMADTAYQGHEAHITTVPIIVNCPKFPVDQVVCTEFATFVRFQSNNLLVYTNYTTRLFKIPFPRAKTFKSVDAFDHFTPREVPSTILDMKCANIYGNNLCIRYSCGRIGMVSTKDESMKLWTKFSNTLPVTLYWAPNFEHRKAMDFSVSSKGHLVVCTANGEIFTSKGIGSPAEKMYSGKLISGRAISVACDPSFVSFGIIKDETMNVPMLCARNRLLEDFSRYSPKYGVSRDRSDFEGFDLPLNACTTNHQFRMAVGEGDDSMKLFKADYSLTSLSQRETTPFHQAGRDQSSNFDIYFIDRTTKKVICKCHKFILSMRCPKLLEKLPMDGESISLSGLKLSCVPDPNKRFTWQFLVDNPDNAEVLEEVIHFLYTDIRPTNQRALNFLLSHLESYHLATLSFALQDTLNRHAGQSNISNSSKNNGKTEHRYGQYSSWAYNREDALKPDVMLILEDGSMYCHSVVLNSRSSTLKAFLKKDWSPKYDHTPLEVNLKNFKNATVENIDCVLRYLYGVPYNTIYDAVRKEYHSEKVQFLLDMLCLCDQLNLEHMKNYTEGYAASFINGETVVPILINAVYSNSRLLAQNCSWFICLHIGILFSKDNLDLVDEHFDPEIWGLLETSLKELRSSQTHQTQLAWYEQDSDWIKLFSTNIDAFNERFMDPQKLFQPVFDLVSEGKPPSRRKSSTHGLDKGHKPISIQKPKIALVEERRSPWDASRTTSESTTIDDGDEFVEVVKKSKRRTSSHTQPSIDTSAKPAISRPSGKVVIHTANESDSEKLPSLIGQKEASPTLVDGDSSVPKIRKSFKKGSQKQRLQQLSNTAQKERDDERKVTWGNGATAKSSTKTAPSVPTRRKKSLPSLYDTDLNASLGKTKKDKTKETWSLGPSTSSEVRSHGSWANVQPYVHDSTKLEIVTPETRPTLEERVAAQEFEKWFEQESSKVQKELSIRSNGTRDGLNALYRADDSLPDFITNQSASKNNNRKLKLKFQSKHKMKAQDSIGPS